ncbi:amidase family protein [Qipengyuania sediminis]|uniref:amidase family protein n=1 Tax=Qipengyuania sediminis TaxID=1532023 RepID=UPI00105A949D|nr:amidase family protein [Qipengyuania sediminis]
MAYPRLTDQPGVAEIVEAVRRGECTPFEVAERAVARIERLDAHINAVVVPDFDRALAAARALGETPGPHQPLFGVAMTVKESFDVAGLPTTWGHPQHAGNIARRDSVVVQRLKAAGAVILGKTNVPPDLADLQSDNPLYGRTNNPHDPTRVAGGSSGGGAAAVAAGMVPCEYGSDIGSSIRNPAHFNGIWGHKTSFGLVSRRGHSHPAAGGQDVHDGPLSVVGPMARSAADLALLLEATADLPLPRRAVPLAGMRLLAVLDHPASEVDEAVRVPIEAAIESLEKAGARVDRSSELLPDLARQHADYLKMLNIAMARGRPSPSGKCAGLLDWFALLDAQARNEYAWEALFAAYDFVLAPPLAFLAFPHDGTPIGARRIAINGADHAFADTLAWAGIATFPGLPATVLPVGDTDGLPCGIQVIGPRWRDFACIAAAEVMGSVLHG